METNQILGIILLSLIAPILGGLVTGYLSDWQDTLDGIMFGFTFDLLIGLAVAGILLLVN